MNDVIKKKDMDTVWRIIGGLYLAYFTLLFYLDKISAYETAVVIGFGLSVILFMRFLLYGDRCGKEEED